MLGTLLAPDAAVYTLPSCCASVCLLPSFGCDSGYRYLTYDPNNAPHGGFGDCAAAPTMCGVSSDMAVPADLAAQDMSCVSACTTATCPCSNPD
jgi:hypothetical protein